MKKCANLHRNPQKLHNPESIDAMSEVVNQYVLKDNVPRTRNCNDFIQNNWAAIIADKT